MVDVLRSRSQRDDDVVVGHCDRLDRLDRHRIDPIRRSLSYHFNIFSFLFSHATVLCHYNLCIPHIFFSYSLSQHCIASVPFCNFSHCFPALSHMFWTFCISNFFFQCFDVLFYFHTQSAFRLLSILMYPVYSIVSEHSLPFSSICFTLGKHHTPLLYLYVSPFSFFFFSVRMDASL